MLLRLLHYRNSMETLNSLNFYPFPKCSRPIWSLPLLLGKCVFTRKSSCGTKAVLVKHSTSHSCRGKDDQPSALTLFLSEQTHMRAQFSRHDHLLVNWSVHKDRSSILKSRCCPVLKLGGYHLREVEGDFMVRTLALFSCFLYRYGD